MGVARRDHFPVRVGSDLHWLQAVAHGTVAQAPVRVDPPSPQGPVGLDGQRMQLSGAHRLPVGARTDAGRLIPVHGRAVAQLPLAIEPPSPERAVALDSERVRGPSTHHLPVGVGTDAHRLMSLVLGTVTELLVAIQAPCPERSVGFDSLREGGARIHAAEAAHEWKKVPQDLRHLTSRSLGGRVPAVQPRGRSPRLDAAEQPIVFSLLDVGPMVRILVREDTAPSGRNRRECAGGEPVGRPNHHGDHLLPRDAGSGIEMGRILAFGDVAQGAYRHILVRIEAAGIVRSQVHERNARIGKVAFGDRKPEGQHDHLCELLASNRVVGPEVTVRVAADDLPRGHAGDGCRIGMRGRDVREARGRTTWDSGRRGRCGAGRGRLRRRGRGSGGRRSGGSRGCRGCGACSGRSGAGRRQRSSESHAVTTVTETRRVRPRRGTGIDYGVGSWNDGDIRPHIPIPVVVRSACGPRTYCVSIRVLEAYRSWAGPESIVVVRYGHDGVRARGGESRCHRGTTAHRRHVPGVEEHRSASLVVTPDKPGGVIRCGYGRGLRRSQRGEGEKQHQDHKRRQRHHREPPPVCRSPEAKARLHDHSPLISSGT